MKKFNSKIQSDISFMMKALPVFILLSVLSISSGCAQSTVAEENSTSESPQITFEETTHDYGTIEYNGDGSYEFVFTNKGKKPLILSNVRSSCGCTVPQWPRDPIAPGNSEKIKVKYNTRISGSFSKSITVYSNAETNPVTLRITGKVLPNQPTN